MGRVEAFDKKLLECRKETAWILVRQMRATPEDAEDAVSEAVLQTVLSGGNCGNTKTEMLEFMQREAKRALGRIRRANGKALSLNQPLDREETEGTDFLSQVVNRHVHENPETHCDAMRVLRAAAELNKRDAELFVLFAEGLTAEQIAEEMAMLPNDVRMERARIIGAVLQGIAA